MHCIVLCTHCTIVYKLIIFLHAVKVGVPAYIAIDNLVEAHCYGIGRTGQMFEQSRSSEEASTFLSVSSLLRDCSKICPVLLQLMVGCGRT